MNEPVAKGPTLALSVKPGNKPQLPDFFSGEDGQFYQLVKNPPYLRYSGWNMLTLDQPKIFEGKGWEVNNGDRKKVRLYADGSLVAVVDAGPDFLGWSTKNYPEINALALIEFCFEFINFYSVFLEKVEISDDLEFKISFLLKNAVNDKGEKLLLVPALLNSIEYSVMSRIRSDENYGYIHSPTVKDELLVKRREFSQPDLLTSRLLEVIFRHFGISSECIPYLIKNANNKPTLDVVAIKSIR